MTRRRGLGKGTGKGYRNIIGKDPAVHSQSAKGIKQPQRVKKIANIQKNPEDMSWDELKRRYPSIGIEDFEIVAPRDYNSALEIKRVAIKEIRRELPESTLGEMEALHSNVQLPSMSQEATSLGAW